HKRGYTQTYQTSCLYGVKVMTPAMNNGSVRLTDFHHLWLPKLGRLRFKGFPSKLLSRADNVRVGTTTVSMDAVGHYFVSLQLGSAQPFVGKQRVAKSKAGIDLNLDNFLTDSNGQVIANPRYYRMIKGTLAKAQRKLSRRARRAKKSQRRLSESKNYQKQRLLVVKLQLKVANQRKNFLHHISTTLIKNHDLVVAEELRSKNMLRNHALAMSIADVGWRTLLGMLAYKADLYGRKFLTVNPRNTTQTCSHCGYIMTGKNKLTLADRKWTCPSCGVFHVRDHNAAKNILAKGLATL
ncbi:RNA-guided endonuclease InsQ/TnpB family protein, partial [Levilactobacillus parabrevis]